MPLPAPKLDDRSFQDLVDDAKRFIQERCPEWTDHNVSDPGITMVETFAWMTDLMLYRLNRVPERTYVKFLDLLGVHRFPPTAARALVDFRLSAPQSEDIEIPAGTEVATPRTANDVATTFTTTIGLTIRPSTVAMVGSRIGSQRKIRDISGTLDMGTAIPCFSDEPVVEDSLYFGLTMSTPDHILVLEFVCDLGGHGILPDRPPLAWEAWDGTNWTPCELLDETTGGLNRTGRVELCLPADHQLADIDDHQFAWVRCRVIESQSRPPYTSSPLIKSVTGYTAGAAVEVLNAQVVDSEMLGTSNGIAGQVFHLRDSPVVPSEDPFVVLASTPDVTFEDADEDPGDPPPTTGYVVWELRADFADSGPEDPHFTLDPHSGVIKFGPLIREPDGSVRRHGAIPPKGAVLSVPRYRTGGGAAGNVSPHAISVLRSSIPMIASVDNRSSARGGVDPESIDDAKDRGPIQLRVRNRAVTLEDFEYLAREAAPELARVKALAEFDANGGPGVRVLLVPDVGPPNEQLELRDVYPGSALRNKVAAYLDERRIVGTRVVVEPPQYLGLRVDAEIDALPDANVIETAERAQLALRRHFHPVHGGRDERGWPFGRNVRIGEVFSVLQMVPGVDVVNSVELHMVNPSSGVSEAAEDVIELEATDLILSMQHNIRVEE